MSKFIMQLELIDQAFFLRTGSNKLERWCARLKCRYDSIKCCTDIDHVWGQAEKSGKGKWEGGWWWSALYLPKCPCHVYYAPEKNQIWCDNLGPQNEHHQKHDFAQAQKHNLYNVDTWKVAEALHLTHDIWDWILITQNPMKTTLYNTQPCNEPTGLTWTKDFEHKSVYMHAYLSLEILFLKVYTWHHGVFNAYIEQRWLLSNSYRCTCK